MRILPADRVSLFGTTGGGKTAGARHLLRLAAAAADQVQHPTYSIYILHTKPEKKFPFAPRFFPGSSHTHVKSLEHILEYRQRVIVVEPKWHEKTDEGFAWFFEQLYWRATKQHRPATVYVDEGNAVTKGVANSGPLFYKLLLTEGRGLESGVWQSYQDPAFLQREVITQATHIFAYWCRSPEDRARLTKSMDCTIPKTYPDPYGFYYAGGREPALYYPDMQSATGVPLIF